MKQYTGLKRRSGKDRRVRHFSLLKGFVWNGRREILRRASDRKKIVALDHYSNSLFIAAIIVIGLSLSDALFTLILISKGAQELNPVMDYYLKYGHHAFLIVKYSLTALSVFVVIVLNEFLITRYKISGIFLLNLFSVTFGVVLLWEIHLLSF
jgi:hypothetical protein